MKTNQNTTNSQSIEGLNAQINDLLGKAKKINNEIDETNEKSRKNLDDSNVKVNESINNVKQLYSDLDKIEKEAGDEMDKLILEQAEDLSSE